MATAFFRNFIFVKDAFGRDRPMQLLLRFSVVVITGVFFSIFVIIAFCVRYFL